MSSIARSAMRKLRSTWISRPARSSHEVLRQPGAVVTLGNDDPERTKKWLRGGRIPCLFARLFRSRAEQECRHVVAEADDRPRVLVALLARPLGAGERTRFRISRPHRRSFVTPLLRGGRRAPVRPARRLRAPARLVVLARLAPCLLVMGLRRSGRGAPLGLPRLVPGRARPLARLALRVLPAVAAAGRGALAARASLLGRLLARRRRILPGDRLPDQPFDRGDGALVAGRDERERGPGKTRPPGAADAMDIVLGMVRHVEIEDVAHRRDVEAAGGDVARDDEQHLAGAERVERRHAGALIEVAV